MLTSEVGQTLRVELDAGEQMVCEESGVNESSTEPPADNDRSPNGLCQCCYKRPVSQRQGQGLDVWGQGRGLEVRGDKDEGLKSEGEDKDKDLMSEDKDEGLKSEGEDKLSDLISEDKDECLKSECKDKDKDLISEEKDKGLVSEDKDKGLISKDKERLDL